MVFILLLSITFPLFAEPGRWQDELSGDGWKLWLDREAEWIDDDIYMPPVVMSELPVNPPSCGWDKFEYTADKTVSVPGTVEEHFWGTNGNPVGVAGDYRVVSWWSRNFSLDPSLEGKRVVLAFDSVNLRAEVFVNRKLVGYDVIGNTPFETDITDAVAYGVKNRLDIRVTDPVGNFDWNDNELYPWGKNNVPGVHGFGGITGKIYVRATDAVHIDDIYIENKPAITDVELFLAVGNSSGFEQNGKMTVLIYESNNPSAILWKKTTPVLIPSEGKSISIPVKAPKAKFWDIDKPNLYTATITFESTNGSIVETMEQRFGFRWFDIGEKDGDKRFYLNGHRVFVFDPDAVYLLILAPPALQYKAAHVFIIEKYTGTMQANILFYYIDDQL